MSLHGNKYDSLHDSKNDELKKRVKILTIVSILLFIILIVVSIVLGYKLADSQNNKPVEIPTASIITPTIDIAINHTITDDSAAAYNRSADFKESPYYKIYNFYDGTLSKTLQILPKFQTYQQTSSYSCGAASAFMAVRYLGVTNITENDIAIAANTKPYRGTRPLDLAVGMKKILNNDQDDGPFTITYPLNDQKLLSWREFNAMLKDNIKNNAVMSVSDNDWGGHWRCIIGFDDMGTPETADDILILADPYDTTDHNQDGYVVQSMERFYSTWTNFNLPEGHQEQQFVTIAKKIRRNEQEQMNNY